MDITIESLTGASIGTGNDCGASSSRGFLCTRHAGHDGAHIATHRHGKGVVIAQAWESATTRIRYRRSYLVRRVQEHDVDVPTELLDAGNAFGELDQWICDNDVPDIEDYEPADDDEAEFEILHRY